jgi:hypothetical protein
MTSMALGERKTTTVTTSASNIDFNADGYAVLVDLNIASSWDGTVDFQTTIDGSNYFNVPYITLATLSASPSVSQLTSLSTARYLLLGPLTQTRISCSAGSTGTLIAVYRVVPSNAPWTSLIQEVSSTGLGVRGTIAHGAADTANAVKVGGHAFTGNRASAVDNNDIVDMAFDEFGHVYTLITGSANNTTPVSVAGADGASTGASVSTLATRAFLYALAPDGEYNRLKTVGNAAGGAGTLAVSPTGHDFIYSTSTTDTAVLDGAGYFHSMTINDVAVDGTLTLYNDPDSATAPVIAVMALTAAMATPFTLHYDIKLSAGLWAEKTGSLSADLTFSVAGADT